MKRFLYVAALLLGLSALFVSCNKDNGGSSSSSLIGTWGMVKEECFEKDGTMFEVINYDGNKDKFVFTESSVTIYLNNSPLGTFAYQYDSSTKKLTWGVHVDVVQKLTTKELVLNSKEEGVDRWTVIYFEKK